MFTRSNFPFVRKKQSSYSILVVCFYPSRIDAIIGELIGLAWERAMRKNNAVANRIGFYKKRDGILIYFKKRKNLFS
jgi:hypothetical protein